MAHWIRGWHVVVGLQLAALVAAACGSGQPGRPGHVLDEAIEGEPDRRRLSGRRRGLLPRHGRRRSAQPEEIQGRNMWIVWTGGNDRFWDRSPSQPRHARLAEDAVVASDAPYSARQPLELPRPGQRAVLHQGDRARPEPLRPVARRPRSEVPAGPVRERRRIPGRRPSARAARPCRSARTTASQRASSACGCFPTRTSTRRRARRGTPSATTTIPSYYFSRDLVKPYRVGMSCGFCHVGPNPLQAAGRSGEPGVGATSARPSARSTSGGDRIFNWQGDTNPKSFFYQPLHDVTARLARHVARLAPTTSTTRGR